MGMFSMQTVPHIELEIPRSRCYIKQFRLLILQALEIMGREGVKAAFTTSRFCRIADGPDEVHMSQLGKLTIRSRVN
jgi:hypothetical protein